MNLNGKVSDGLTISNYTTWVFIIGFDHNKEREGTGIAFQGFKETDKGYGACLVDSSYDTGKTSGTWFNMNNTATNSGGWEACLMRKNVMPLIKASFPSDLRAVIKPSTIFTAPNGGDAELTATQDEVFLLATYEVFGDRWSASVKEPNYLKQYSYYSAGNSKRMWKHNDADTSAYWRLRSPDSTLSDRFMLVSNYGTSASVDATTSEGVAPVFKV